MTTIVGAMPPPPGVTPQFHGPMTDKAKQLVIAAAVTIGLTTFFLALRLYTRGIIVRSFGSDDIAVTVAWAFGITFSAFAFVAADKGLGQHLWNIPATELHSLLQLIGTVAIIYAWATTGPKIALLLLYHRLSSDKTFRIAIYVLLFIIAAYTTAETGIIAAGCSPVDSSGAGCLNKLGFAGAIMNIVCDGFVMLLPLPLVYSLQLPIRQKIALALLFAGGSLVIIASIIRIRFEKELEGKKDFTFEEADVGIWSIVEINVGIICVCLVVMKPFFRKYMSGLLGSSGGSSHSPFSFNIGSVFSRFKKQTEPRSYRLTSLDRSARLGDQSVQVPDRSITVSHTYEVSRNRGEFDTESTEDMVKSAGQDRPAKDLV